jgi:hypothetical protein
MWILKILNLKKKVTEFCKYRIYLYVGDQIHLHASLNRQCVVINKFIISYRNHSSEPLKYAIGPQYYKSFRYEI